jgi:hypothetical protein
VGVDSRVVYPDEIKDLCPQLDISDHPTFPILAALYHPPGGVIRHDAVVWGYGKEADKMGVEIHQYTDVTGINVENGKVTGVETNRGTINCDTVISCVAGWSTLVCDLVGVPLPLTTHILQACVTEPVKPLLDKIIVSGTLHIYISQSDRGEFVMGSEIEPYSGYSNTSTFRFIEDLAMHMIELLRRMAAEGRTILFSSHILEEVERLAQDVLVIYAGRLAASGDFREIRRLMTDRPTFTVRSGDDRALAAALVGDASVFGVELSDGLLSVRASDFAAFTHVLPRIARERGISLHELRPTDESLESVFAYLVRR